MAATVVIIPKLTTIHKGKTRTVWWGQKLAAAETGWIRRKIVIPIWGVMAITKLRGLNN